jgi:hypothetical protein
MKSAQKIATDTVFVSSAKLCTHGIELRFDSGNVDTDASALFPVLLAYRHDCPGQVDCPLLLVTGWPAEAMSRKAGISQPACLSLLPVVWRSALG